MSSETAFPRKNDWLGKTTLGDVSELIVKQRRYDPLILTAINIVGGSACLFFSQFLADPNQASRSGWTTALLLVLIIGGIGLLIVGLLSLIPAISVALSTASTANIKVYKDRIEIESDRRNAKIESFELSNISGMYLHNSKQIVQSNSSNTTFVGFGTAGVVAATTANTVQNTATGVGEMIREIVSTASAKITLNHKGEEKILAKRLSNDEAQYLFHELSKILKFSKR